MCVCESVYKGRRELEGDKGLAAFLFVLCAVYVTVRVCVCVWVDMRMCGEFQRDSARIFAYYRFPRQIIRYAH